MEDLNNHQMVLLTTLVAFVTSIATGIITVALLQEAPQTVTQTVNRVVERTIERVVTGSSTPEKQVATQPQTITNEVTKEVTVYAKEDDLIIGAVEKNQPRVAVIYPLAGGTNTPMLGTGFVVSRDGLIVTSHANLLIDGTAATSYRVSIGDNDYTAQVIEVSNVSKALTFLKISNLPEKKAVDAVSFSSSATPRLGQTVVLLGGEAGSGIFKTTFSRFVYEKGEGTTTPRVLGGIEVTPKIPDGYNGALVVNLDGIVVGMSIYNDSASRYTILPAETILDAINTIGNKSSAQIVPADHVTQG